MNNILIFLSITAIFSCTNSTTEQPSESTKIKESCVNINLAPDKETQIRQRINADQKAIKIDEIFQKKAIGGFNGNVLIAQDGVVLYKKSFGFAQIENKDTLRSEAKFQLASLSKTFTAIAALQLVQAKKIGLDDSVRKYIPGFPYPDIQIKSLLSHRSGLPNYAYVLTDSVRQRNKFPNNADIVRWLCAVKPKPYNIPNRYFSYSNTNYALLAVIIEKMSGLSFEAYLKKNIFEPLGMKNTFLVTTQNDSLNLNRTVGYQYNRRIPKDNYDDVVGDKGVYSTTEDIFKWYIGLTNHCILSKELTKEAFMPRSFERNGIKNYGYGFRMHVSIEDPQNPKYIYHTGWWKGYNTLMWFNPTDKFVIIILSNRYNRNIYQIKPLLEILHGTTAPDDVEDDMFQQQ
jgi:CubicO group peptidase (beta-lactamase class C family)